MVLPGLARRLSQYLNTEKNYFNSKVGGGGLLLPLIERDGISAFSLKVIVLPPELSSAREGKTLSTARTERTYWILDLL